MGEEVSGVNFNHEKHNMITQRDMGLFILYVLGLPKTQM